MAKKKTTTKNKIPAFWISGNYYDCRKTWESILSKMGDCQVIVHDCTDSIFDGTDSKSSSVSNIIKSLKSKDIFDPKPKIIKVNGLPVDYKLLSEYLHLVSDKNILVIDSPVGYRKARRFVSAATSKLCKEIKSKGFFVDHGTEASNNSDAISWVKKVVKESGKEIDSAAAVMLVEQIGGRNYDLLYAHLRKLVDYCNKKITEEDVKTCCASIYLQTVWEIIDALDRRECHRVMDSLQTFYQHAESSGVNFKGEIEQFFGALSSHYALLLILKDGCPSLTYPSAKKAVEGFKKRVKSGDEYVWEDGAYNRLIGMAINNKAFQQAFNWNKAHIYKVNMDLDRVRMICRKSNSEAEIKTCLDTFALLVCNKLDLDQAAIARGYEG